MLDWVIAFSHGCSWSIWDELQDLQMRENKSFLHVGVGDSRVVVQEAEREALRKLLITLVAKD